MKIPEALKKLLPAEALEEIAKTFDEQVELHVESAKATYDKESTEKVKKLLSVIDESYAVKFNRIKEKTIETVNAYKKAISDKHLKELQEEAVNFKSQLSKHVLRYIDLKIENIVPYDVIKEASHNNTARLVLDGLRKQLSVDSVLMKESISGPLLEMKNMLAELQDTNRKLAKENKLLQERVEENDNNLLIESRVAALSQDEADHMRRLMTGKPTKFISENFEYALSIFKNQKNKNREELKNKALTARAKNPNTIQEAKIATLIPKNSKSINENIFVQEDPDSELISELSENYGRKY